MGLKTSCDGCGAVVFGSMTKVKGRYLCTQCASNPNGELRYYCNACHNYVPKALKKGNGWIELVLYFAYLVPGIIYSFWRRSGSPNVCPLCNAAALVPAAVAKPLATSSTSAGRDEIDCPFCAERILARASVCKHCGKQVRATS